MKAPGLVRATGFSEALKRRVYGFNDIVSRKLFLGRDNLVVVNHPVRRVSAVFNPGVLVDNDVVHLYPRIVYGYYMYVSAVGYLSLSLDYVLEDNLYTDKLFEAEIVVYPDEWFDMVGVEDPRIYFLGDELYMTYCGRSIDYYEKRRKGMQGSYPVTAINTGKPNAWVKKTIYAFPEGYGLDVFDDRDAFLLKSGNNTYLFHRPTLTSGDRYLLISRVGEPSIERESTASLTHIYEPVEVLEPAPFEEKIGWATPPVSLGRDQYLVFLHGVDALRTGYHLFALQLSIKSSEISIEAVTPKYIMTLTLFPEKYGERSFTIFPTGLSRINRNEYLIAYGAADLVLGLGIINLDDVLRILDEGRIF